MDTLREPLHIDAVAGLDPATPVVMLNLMEFPGRSRGGSGSRWDAHVRYSKNTAPLFKARGATILWAGDVGAVALGPRADGDWDYAVLVWYPRPAAFIDRMTSSDYLRGNADRENGTERHLILATRTTYSKLAAPAG